MICMTVRLIWGEKQKLASTVARLFWYFVAHQSILLNRFLEVFALEGWRDALVTKSPCFCSQLLHNGSQLSITLVSGDLVLSFGHWGYQASS